jgi:hypothetical protein
MAHPRGAARFAHLRFCIDPTGQRIALPVHDLSASANQELYSPNVFPSPLLPLEGGGRSCRQLIREKGTSNGLRQSQAESIRQALALSLPLLERLIG